ncbi:hypothetical protein DXG01_000279 [Tephrocybe rancida]|nr:hypothetical protein DXG01_000279 [Tephrocybe rancida]
MAPYFLKNLIPRKEQRAEARPLLQVLKSLTWVIFGILSDRFGRKWPLVSNLVLIAILQLGGGFVQTFKQFLACRSLFGIGMGGIWGLAASTALENLPVEVRGLASGVLQQGYAVGYLLAACINLTLVPDTPTSWRSLFWTASGISLFAGAIRAVLPESEVFLRAKAIEKAKGTSTSKKTKVFVKETGEMLKRHWLLCIYAVLLMTGFNFLSHGSQDLYPTYLQQSKNFSAHNATVATIIGNWGYCVSLEYSTGLIFGTDNRSRGGIAAGYISQYLGRRLTIVGFPSSHFGFSPVRSAASRLAHSASNLVYKALGVLYVPSIPIQLAEMSPPAFRATFPGVAYQLGNMVSSAASQIEATGGENLRTNIIVDGKLKNVPDYATVQGILIGVVAAFVIFITIIGPEKHGSHFEKHKTAFEEGAARDDALLEDEAPADSERREQDSVEEKEKPSVEQV